MQKRAKEIRWIQESDVDTGGNGETSVFVSDTCSRYGVWIGSPGQRLILDKLSSMKD